MQSNYLGELCGERCAYIKKAPKTIATFKLIFNYFLFVKRALIDVNVRNSSKKKGFCKQMIKIIFRRQIFT